MDDIDEPLRACCQTVVDTLGRLEAAFRYVKNRRSRTLGICSRAALFKHGLVELAELARALELAGRDGHMEEARDVYEKLRPALEFF